MRNFFGIAVLTSLAHLAVADVATLPFSSCFSGPDSSKQLVIDTVYSQVLGNPGDYFMNLTIVGSSASGIQGYTNDSGGQLSTLFTTTDVLTLSVNDSATYFCNTLNPSPLYTMNNQSNLDPAHPPRYCPLPAGPFAFSSMVPLGGSNRALTTLITRLRAVDPFSAELFCIDVLTTPVDAALAGQDGQMGEPNSHYGQAIYIFWVSIALAIAYFIMTSIARLTAAWGRGLYHASSPARSTGATFWARAQSAGYIIASAISGERLSSSPSLLRFCTPSAKDIVLHTQFCAILAMIRVEWAGFVYPLLAQASWATLAYNITLTDTVPIHYSPTSPSTLSPNPVSYPSTFADQFNDASSSIYINSSVDNVLLLYPHNSTNDGIEKFAYILGVRPQDLFPVALVVFLGAIAATIVVSLFFWGIDLLGTAFFGEIGPGGIGKGRRDSAAFGTSGTRSPLPFSSTGSKDALEAAGGASPVTGSVDGHTSLNLFRPPSKFTLSGLGTGNDRSGTPGLSRGLGKKRWWRRYIPRHATLASFHFSVLHGNLVRLLALFHLPITIFSTYQLALPTYKENADQWDIATSGTLKGLAGLSYALFSILLPSMVMFRIFRTPTNKLFSETRTLLSLGPLYNVYSQGSQHFVLLYLVFNLIFGTVLGASQGATPSTSGNGNGGLGLAEAVILLIFEIVGALVTSIWLPWGFGAGMGLWSFLSCVGRIVVAVMVIILSGTVSIGPGPAAWVTYGILVIVALHYLAFIVGFFVKLIEAIVRIITHQPFRNSTSSIDAGLLGACCAGRRRKNGRRRKAQKSQHRYNKTSDGLLPNQGGRQLPSANRSSTGFAPPPPLGSGAASSIHSGQTPSVLRPEQAYKDYDSDDDLRQESGGAGGFIMGAWKPQGDGYEPVSSEGEAPIPKKTSGFSRVGGGKAKMDNPYSALPAISSAGPSSPISPITPASTAPVASVPSPTVHNAVPFASPSTSQPSALPPGAAQPAQPSHIRTKSQTAIVEHFAPAIPQPTSNLAGPYSVPVFSSDEEDEEDGPSQGRRMWNLFSRKKRASTGGIPSSPSVDTEQGGLGAGTRQSLSLGERGTASESGPSSSTSDPPQRTFVVIRKGQAGGTGGNASGR